jgi:phosphoribosylformylglycinamidine (FGAM) synthase PurS component
MNDGSTHYYVINNKEEILDPQGIALRFQVEDYQKTLTPEIVTSSAEVLSTPQTHYYDWWIDAKDDFTDESIVKYMSHIPLEYGKQRAESLLGVIDHDRETHFRKQLVFSVN